MAVAALHNKTPTLQSPKTSHQLLNSLHLCTSLKCYPSAFNTVHPQGIVCCFPKTFYLPSTLTQIDVGLFLLAAAQAAGFKPDFLHQSNLTFFSECSFATTWVFTLLFQNCYKNRQKQIFFTWLSHCHRASCILLIGYQIPLSQDCSDTKWLPEHINQIG